MDTMRKAYDLEERTAKFGEGIIVLCKSSKQDTVSKRIIDQLVRSGTSVGANYMEANGASSRKDFRNKIHLCRKEVQETKHWLRMLLASGGDKHQIAALSGECHELVLIFNKISKTITENSEASN